MNVFLHSEVLAGFKMQLIGTGFPEEFREGDILELGNSIPDNDAYALFKRNGKYEIERYDDNAHGGALKELLGMVDSFRRSVVPWGIFLGDDPDRNFIPAPCSNCDRIEVLEMAGKVYPFCWTPTRLKKVSVNLKRCICGSMISSKGGE